MLRRLSMQTDSTSRDNQRASGDCHSLRRASLPDMLVFGARAEPLEPDVAEASIFVINGMSIRVRPVE
jgi:hypothetical protein